MFNSYRKRVLADGETIQEATLVSTKRQMVNYILDSPSLSYVFVNMSETIPIPCIVSDYRTFRERRFLFLPDMKVYVGDYITTDNMTYLATNAVYNEIYPQLYGELCNVDFPIKTTENKIRVGSDAMGRPLYKTEITEIKRPSVMTDKIYSQANNNPIPLPDGSIICKIPYSEDEINIPEINAIVNLHGMEYKVTTISYEYVLKGKGVLEIQLQRIPKS